MSETRINKFRNFLLVILNAITVIEIYLWLSILFKLIDLIIAIIRKVDYFLGFCFSNINFKLFA